MKDPDATSFRDVAWCGSEGGAITGEYNSKNSYGAYEGFKPFYYADGEFVGDAGDDRFVRLHRRCMRDIGRETARLRGTLYNEATDSSSGIDNRTIDQIVDHMIENSGAAAVDNEHAVNHASGVEPQRDDPDEEVPVCDRPDSAEKFALMNEIGVDCLGE